LVHLQGGAQAGALFALVEELEDHLLVVALEVDETVVDGLVAHDLNFLALQLADLERVELLDFSVGVLDEVEDALDFEPCVFVEEEP